MHEILVREVTSCAAIRAEYLTKRQKRGGGGGFSADLLTLRFCQLNTVVFRNIRKTNKVCLNVLNEN